MKVLWTARSEKDLLEIGRFIAKDSRTTARRWTAKLKRKAHEAARNPRAGRQAPEFEREDVREVLLKSYRIVYRIQVKHIEILTVFEGHRLLPMESPDKS